MSQMEGFLNKSWIYFMFASGRGSIKMFGKEKLIQEKNNLEADKRQTFFQVYQ